MEKLSLLVVAAHASEITPLETALARSSIANVRCAALGVGAIESAIGMNHALAIFSPEKVLLVGSCGVYPGVDDIQMGDMICANEVVWADISLLQNQSQLPQSVITRISMQKKVHKNLDTAFQLKPARVAQTAAVTVDDALAARFAQLSQAQVENLEAFSVALATQKSGIPLSICLYVTNVVGSKSREQWREHQGEAAKSIADGVLRLMN